jgi:hypothetical protein
VILPSLIVIRLAAGDVQALAAVLGRCVLHGHDMIDAYGDVDESCPEGPARQRTELCQKVVDDGVRAAMIASNRAVTGQHQRAFSCKQARVASMSRSPSAS